MLLKRAPSVPLLVVLMLGTIALGLARSAPVAGQDAPDTQAKIENAMSAAPSTVAANATILDNEMDDAGKFVVLREGNNGWFCQPDIAIPRDRSHVRRPDVAGLDVRLHAGEAPKVTVPGSPTCCRAAAIQQHRPRGHRAGTG